MYMLCLYTAIYARFHESKSDKIHEVSPTRNMRLASAQS